MSLATILAIWVAFTAHFSVSSDASHLPSNALSLKNENRIKIDLIDVKCDKNEKGMHVTIQFSHPFEGIIYSSGYFNDPKCRYVTAGEGDQSYNFVVPFEGCGSKPSCSICDSVDNVLVIQLDEEVQGEFDAARKISCSRTGVEEEKKVFFKPFIVQNLDVITVPTKHGGVDCWMDIQRGVYPKLTAIGDVIKIGEELSVLVYLRDPKKEYDLTVRNCWAYDSADFDDKKTVKVQLSDSSGCAMKRKLFGSWHKTDQTGSSGATLLLHNTLKAFKFPDESQVYLKCDIEICRGNCAEAICDADEINKVDSNKIDCTLNSLHEKCIRDKFSDRSSDSLGFTTVSYKPQQQPSSTSKITTRVPFENTRRPSFVFTTTQRANYVSTLPDQEPTTLRPFVCTPDSTDIRCIQPQYYETTEATEAATFRDATTYQNLFKTTTLQPLKPAVHDSFCKLNPRHHRCNQRVTEDLGSNLEILTFKPPSPFATVKYHTTTEIPSRNLKYVSTTEFAATTEQPLNCNGPFLDPRCPNPTPTSSPPTYLPPKTTQNVVVTTKAPRCYPGSLDPRCPKITITTPSLIRPTTKAPITKTTKKFFICVPGSNDVNCDYESRVTEEPPVERTTIPSLNRIDVTKQPEKPVCFFGSTNPECQKVSTQILTFKPRPTTTAIPPTTTVRPFVSTSRIPTCYPGSFDARCVHSTTKKVFVSYGPTTPATPSTTGAPICYPGSTDERCPKTTTTKRIINNRIPEIATELPVTTTYIPPTITDKPICYLGSQDPKCRQVSFASGSNLSTRPQIPTTKAVPSTQRAPICYPGSLDTRCRKPSTAILSEVTVTQKIAPETTTYAAPSTTSAPICYFGSQDPRCVQSTTRRVLVSIGTTRPPISFTPSTTRAPICYLGSLDPRCPKQATTIKTIIPEITSTQKAITETRRPVCYPGALDPRCRQPTTEKQPPTVNLISTTFKSSFSTTPAPVRCYPGSLDPRCTTKQSVMPLQCGPRLLDPRCPNPTPTAEPATYLPPKISTVYNTKTTQAPTFVCTPNSVDPRCKIGTTLKNIPTEGITATFPPERTTQRFVPTTTATQRPIYTSTTRPPFSFPIFTTRPPVKIVTSNPPFFCTPNSLDPRCRITSTTKFVSNITTYGSVATFSPETTTRKIVPPSTTFTQRPTYTTTTRPPYSFPTFTTRPPVRISTTLPPAICTPNSLDPRCYIDDNEVCTTRVPNVSTKIPSPTTRLPDITTKVIPTLSTTTTQRPTYTTSTRAPFSFPTFTTRRIIQSSPQPFTTRPTTKSTSTTTENVLCYPGSTIEGCKQTGETTPSYCFPGSKDPRCPQLPPSFSTRQPSTYLPPFLDARFNRVRRQVKNEPTPEIVKFSLSFKTIQF